MVLSGVPRKKSPVTPPGIDPGTVRLVALHLNHYATPCPYKNKYTETKQYKNTVNTSTRITKTPTHYKTPTYTHPHITKQVKTTTVQDTHQIKLSQYNQVPSV